MDTQGKKSRNPIKLPTKSTYADYFLPMLTSFAEKNELNDIAKNCVVKSCELLEEGIELYPEEFSKEHDAGMLRAEYEAYTAEELASLEEIFNCAGRIISHRSFGKIIFFHILDKNGRIQCYASKEHMGEKAFSIFKKFDIGDIVGVKGTLFRTKLGELTICCLEVTLLAKSFRSLPEKHKGLTNVALRYRQRYVDLIVNPKTRAIFHKRSKIIHEVRLFLEEHGFSEVETPILHPIPGGALARPFVTHNNALDMQLYMRIAPELYLKRLLVGGFEKIFELNRCFRNEGISVRHNPEFTMCEFYWAYATFYTLMDFTEKFFSYVAQKVCGTNKITYQEHTINLTPGSWKRYTFYEALEKIGNHSSKFYMNAQTIQNYLKERGEKIVTNDKLGKLQAKLFELDVEEKLIQPTFIYYYPIDISPLAKKNNKDPNLTNRFELFIAGQELANAFSELNDPIDQRIRFEEQVKEKEAGEEEACPMDEDYLRALEYGMPPAAGEGIGIDRLVMLFTDTPSIKEVLLFPLLKPEQ